MSNIKIISDFSELDDNIRECVKRLCEQNYIKAFALKRFSIKALKC
jgi:hypothetical protein